MAAPLGDTLTLEVVEASCVICRQARARALFGVMPAEWFIRRDGAAVCPACAVGRRDVALYGER